MYLLFALFFSSFNGIIDLPWQIVLTQKNTYFLLHFFMFFFSGISDPPLADCLDTKSNQKSQDWIFLPHPCLYF